MAKHLIFIHATDQMSYSYSHIASAVLARQWWISKSDVSQNKLFLYIDRNLNIINPVSEIRHYQLAFITVTHFRSYAWNYYYSHTFSVRWPKYIFTHKKITTKCEFYSIIPTYSNIILDKMLYCCYTNIYSR